MSETISPAGSTACASWNREVSDALELVALAEADGDAAMVAEAGALRALAEEAKRREIESLLSGEADANDAYVEINAGAGGTEAQDWAEMLMRMYMRWAEQHGYKVQLMEQSEGEQAGIKSATLQISGPNAYGWLKTEAGVHRLVRISPFDPTRGGIPVSPASGCIRWSTTTSNRDQRSRFEGGHLSRIGRGRTARQQDRERDPHHAHADGHHRRVPDRPQSAPQPRMAMAMLKARLYEAELQRREAACGGARRRQDRHRLGPSDPQLCAGTVSVGQGAAHRRREGQPDAVLDAAIWTFMAAAWRRA